MSKISMPVLGTILGWDFASEPFTNITFRDVTYPPYNVVQIGEDRRIELAVAGFDESQLSVTFQSNVLTVSGRTEDSDGDLHSTEDAADTSILDGTPDRHSFSFLKKGISTRPFSASWKISPEFVIDKAVYLNGILKIDLKYSPPESLKARTIEIQRSERQVLMEDTPKGKKAKT